MTFGSKSLKKPKSVSLQSYNCQEIDLLVSGQGVLIFSCPYTDICKISILNSDKTDGLIFGFNPVGVYAIRQIDGSILKDQNNTTGLINNQHAYYWISLDSQNQRLYAGIGEARIENVIYHYQWSWTPEQDDQRKANKAFLESLCDVTVSEGVSMISLLRDPITRAVPLLILDTDSLTIDDVASNGYLPHSNLDTIGQKLYNCVSGKLFQLDDESFPDFSKAIEYSIKTPGLWCHERLKQKATEFNKDKPDYNETYLRITLGENNGESPGIPYVIEIWPSGHYSPVHNHSSANAIIRVLHGSIHVSLYPFLADGIKPFGAKDFSKNDITWISPTLNQTHQLMNIGQETCITIQCYMYDLEDNRHYDYFDYIDSNGDIEQYEPDSDMEFSQFKNLMKQEWSQVNKQLQTPNQIDYNKFTLAELKDYCKSNGIKGSTNKKRHEIMELIAAAKEVKN